MNITGREISREFTDTTSCFSSVGMDDLNDMKMFVAYSEKINKHVKWSSSEVAVWLASFALIPFFFFLNKESE